MEGITRVKQYLEFVRNETVSVEEYTARAIDESRKINSEYNYFNVITEQSALEQAREIDRKIKANKKVGKLAGLLVSVKDCICVKGVESRAGSKILDNYKPLFDATVVARLKKEDAIIIGKTSQDEFGFGSFNANVGVDFKIPLNPFDKERVTGGSSGGSSGMTQKASFAHVSLGESTGGSIVAPAAFCSVYGLCPTYGRVSRYGMMDYGSSLDKIGPITKDLYENALVMEVISGHDTNESTTLNVPNEEHSKYLENGNRKIRDMKIGVVKEAFGEGVSEDVRNMVWENITELQNQGVEIEEVSLPLTMKYSVPTYYLLAVSEASTNLAMYCGMRYGKNEKLEGNFNEYFSEVRSKNFGAEAKRRIILGTFARMSGYRDAYYIRAAKVRTLIINEYKRLFKRFDALVTPTMPILPPKFSEIEKLTPLQNYMMDIMTVGPNLAGMPHLNVPAGFENGLPVGMLLVGDHLQEGKLLRLANGVY
ncbi:TPA: Asp-tRNA(Asn)/Glu-tRNA(Gln) amidotransferase subunit GatA [Candidatus Woesearchaeota archaeon]|nr:Asp-tRNA(Asn)/Glu-tRNA(Gln) amidotransferase subunit GatA [Candidatus Woesearchaeota archaeon]